MRTRKKWIVIGIAAGLALIGAAIWIWQASSTPPTTEPMPDASPSASPSVSVQDRVQARLDEHLEACAESVASAPPEGCGIRIPWGTEFSSVAEIHYRIDALPALEGVDAASTGFLATGGVLVATVTGVGQDGAQRTETYRTEDWSVRGDLTVDDDDIVLTVW